jgi:transposase
MSQDQTSVMHPDGAQPVAQPDPEVAPQAKRRTYTAAYKLRILQEADSCNQPGEIGALLRREGLYSSHLSTWRRQRAAGELEGLTGKKRGRKAKQDAKDAQIAKLQRENEQLRAQLEQAELIIAAQKKLAQALEQTLTANRDERS